MNKIELIDIDLLDDTKKLNIIDYWLKVMNWENGWHYDLDIIWILQHIESLQLPNGSVILDAGAGLGVTQFLLAAIGYNVISLDFAERNVPERGKDIFEIDIMGEDLDKYYHSYKEFIDYSKLTKREDDFKRILHKLQNAIADPRKIVRYVKQRVATFQNTIYYYMEKNKNHIGFGKITFLKGIFNNIRIDDNQIDLIVSVSAFEHNKYDDMQGTVEEFERILKPRSAMLVTTSAAQDKDWYHEPSQGWCLTGKTLSEWFEIDITEFEYEAHFRNITTSKKLKQRISDYYRYSSNNGLPYADLSNAKYIPVGIVKTKRELPHQAMSR